MVLHPLEGLSHWLLAELLREQMQRARTLKTTIGMAFSLGDVIKQGAPLSKLADTVRSQKACVALLGEPGSGKSTTAR